MTIQIEPLNEISEISNEMTEINIEIENNNLPNIETNNTENQNEMHEPIQQSDSVFAERRKMFKRILGVLFIIGISLFTVCLCVLII